jgi:hypothetical protein
MSAERRATYPALRSNTIAGESDAETAHQQNSIAPQIWPDKLTGRTMPVIYREEAFRSSAVATHLGS